LDVTAMATFGESLVVGNKYGDVDMWSPPGAVKPGWTQLLAGGGPGVSGKVTAIVEVGSPGTQGYGVVTVSETAGVDFYDTTWQKTDLSSLNSPVTAATAYGTGVALGLEDGTVHSWDGTVAATQGWTVLREEGWGQAVSAILPYEQGLIVGLGGAGKSGAVEYYNVPCGAGGGWLELQGTGWGSPVTQMINYRSDARGDGVVVGLGDGSVHMWNGPLQKPAKNHATLYAFERSMFRGDALYSNNGGYQLTLQSDGNLVLRSGEKELWASGTGGKGVVEARLQREDGNFVLYTAAGVSVAGTGQNGAVIPTATSGKDVSLTVDDTGNVVLYNGAGDVLWKTDTSDGQRLASVWTWWTQLHDSNWDTGGGAVTALVPVSLSAKNASGNVVLQDGVIVGLNNGAVEQWSGGGDVVAGYSSSWTEIAKGNIPENLRNHAADALAVKDKFKCAEWQCSQSGALKDAVDFARGLTDGGGSGSQEWNSENGIGSAADKIFGNQKFQKGSPVEGTYYTFAYYNEITPDAVSYSFPDGGGTPSIQAGLDVIPVAYGYTYVPDGFFPKIHSENWSFGLLAAAGGGASVNIDVGADPEASLWGPEKELAKTEKYELTPYGAFAVDAGVNLGANFTVTGLPDKEVVSAHAWVFGGMLGTFNTFAAPGKFNFGFNWYPDIDASDFKDVTAASATVTLTPYANLNYGLFLPKDIPLIGGWSFLKLSLGYENPLYATVCVDANKLCPAAGGSGVANFYGTINDGTDSGDAGSILTVTKQALFNPTKLAVGQRVTGDGVESGTTITTKVGENYTVKICDYAGENCTDSTQAFDDGNLTAYRAGSVASIAMGASGLLTVHAGALEAFTESLSYDMKIPLYEYSEVVELF